VPVKVPLRDGSYLTDPEGNILTTEFRPDILNKLGDETGGEMYVATEAGIRDLLIEQGSGSGRRVPWGYDFQPVNRFRFFLGLALLCLAASAAVKYVRWKDMF